MNLPASGRLLLEADLVPMQGHRFQPTGFADLGAATYTLPSEMPMLLVESAQSMANRLEKTIITPEGELVSALTGLSYVRAKLKGLRAGEVITTTSLLEAHRLNSPFIMADKDFCRKFCTDAAILETQPLNWGKIARAIFKYDVNSLLHGVFLVNLAEPKAENPDKMGKPSGRVKMPRLISAFIEASNVREALSGGVKNNHLDPSGTLRAQGLDKDVYGNVPYTRTEFTAERITAYVNLDVGGIRDLGLEPKAAELLFLLGLYKVRALLDGGLRLRTACDLRLAGEVRCTEPQDFALPTLEELQARLAEAIVKCGEFFASPPVSECSVDVKKAEEKKGGNARAEQDEDDQSATDAEEV